MKCSLMSPIHNCNLFFRHWNYGRPPKPQKCALFSAEGNLRASANAIMRALNSRRTLETQEESSGEVNDSQ